MRKIALMTVALALAASLAARAAGPSDVAIETTLDSEQVLVGETVTLTITVTGKNLPDDVSVEVVGLGSDPGFTIVSSNQGRTLISGSSSVMIVNGKIVQQSKDGVEQVAQAYVLRANTPGNYKIGPARFSYGGQTYESGKVAFSVSSQPTSPTDVTPKSDVFLHAEVEPKTTYVGGQIRIKYYIYCRAGKELEEVGRFELPQLFGFEKGDFQATQKETRQTRMIGAETYIEYYLGRMIVFPLTAGKQTIGAASIPAAIRILMQSHPAYGTRYRRIENELVSEETTVDVLPLPEGKPAKYSGAIGKFEVRASADKREARVGDSIALTVTVEGTGNLLTAAEPSLNLPAEVQAYPPEKDERNYMVGDQYTDRVTLKYILVPRKEGALKLGPVTFSYFDPTDGAYRTASSEPLSLNVTPGVSSAAPSVSGVAPQEITSLGADIAYIKPDAQHLADMSRPYYTRPWFVAFQTLPLFAVAGSFLLRRRRDRLSGDLTYARKVKASGVARERLKAAESAMRNAPQEFYLQTRKAVVGFIADRTASSEAGMTSDELRSLLSRQGASAELIANVVALCERCDAARYSPIAPSSDSMRNDYSEALTIVADLAALYAGKARA